MASLPSRPTSFPDPSTAGTVIVGISGGVDSAVAALLLCRWGYAVQGLYMVNWEDDDDAYCTTAADFQDARRMCEVLGIPLHRASFAAEYRQRVFEHFLREYAGGRTPNPDVLCNREVKFGVCLEHIRRLGSAWIATGHYARAVHSADGSHLLKAIDQAKDQSYFLHAISGEALGRCLFPIGNLRKNEVRSLAHAAGLPVFDKPDSTGICFIGERPFADFLSRYISDARGPIETGAGRVVGEHRGLAFYTLGQRAGLRLGGLAGEAQAPWYVAAKDVGRNTLIVVQNPDHPLLQSDVFDVADLHWLRTAPPAGTDLHVKTRYRQQDLACRISGDDGSGWCVELARPARAVTPGQYAVFYGGDECLGGGVIARPRSRQAPHLERALEYN